MTNPAVDTRVTSFLAELGYAGPDTPSAVATRTIEALHGYRMLREQHANLGASFNRDIPALKREVAGLQALLKRIVDQVDATELGTDIEEAIASALPEDSE